MFVAIKYSENERAHTGKAFELIFFFVIVYAFEGAGVLSFYVVVVVEDAFSGFYVNFVGVEAVYFVD